MDRWAAGTATWNDGVVSGEVKLSGRLKLAALACRDGLPAQLPVQEAAA